MTIGCSLSLGWLFSIIFSLGWGLDVDDGGLLLGVGGWHNLGVSWETELLDEVLDTGVGEEIVVPSPVVHLVKVSSGLEGFDGHPNVEVWNGGDLLMGRKISVLLDNSDTLSEEVLEDISSFLSRN